MHFTHKLSRRRAATATSREGRTGEPLTDHLELHLVELPKLQGGPDRNDEPSLAAWGEQREMALLSYEFDLAKVHREGKAEGRLEGKAELLLR